MTAEALKDAVIGADAGQPAFRVALRLIEHLQRSGLDGMVSGGRSLELDIGGRLASFESTKAAILVIERRIGTADERQTDLTEARQLGHQIRSEAHLILMWFESQTALAARRKV